MAWSPWVPAFVFAHRDDRLVNDRVLESSVHLEAVGDLPPSFAELEAKARAAVLVLLAVSAGAVLSGLAMFFRWLRGG